MADIDPRSLRLLGKHDYPGNVRGSSNMLQRGAALAEASRPEARHLHGHLYGHFIKP